MRPSTSRVPLWYRTRNMIFCFDIILSDVIVCMFDRLGSSLLSAVLFTEEYVYLHVCPNTHVLVHFIFLIRYRRYNVFS